MDTDKNKVKPLSPKEVANDPDIPDYVIETINGMLRKRFRPGGECVFTQKEILEEILKNAPVIITSSILFDKGYMDFESTFEKVGWKVDYDKPGYNESYEATFTFSEK